MTETSREQALPDKPLTDAERQPTFVAVLAFACVILLAGCVPSAQYAQQTCLKHDGVDRVIQKTGDYVIVCNDGSRHA